MFEKFRKNVADTANELPKEDRKGYIEGVKGTEVYGKAREEHLEQAQMTQEKWTEHLKVQEELKQKKEQIKQIVDELQSKIDELKGLGINTEQLEVQLTEILREKAENTIEINGQKVELGPDLGLSAWTDIERKLDELNASLKEDEKPWRIPTKSEFEEIGRPIQEIWSSNLSKEEKEKQAKEYIETLGFAWGGFYWSRTEFADNSGSAWGWSTSYGSVGDFDKRYEGLVRCVR